MSVTRAVDASTAEDSVESLFDGGAAEAAEIGAMIVTKVVAIAKATVCRREMNAILWTLLGLDMTAHRPQGEGGLEQSSRCEGSFQDLAESPTG